MKDEYEAILFLKKDYSEEIPIQICVNRFSSITKFCKWYEDVNESVCDVDLFSVKQFKKLDVKTIMKVWRGL